MQHPYIKYEQDKTWTVVNDLIRVIQLIPS